MIIKGTFLARICSYRENNCLACIASVNFSACKIRVLPTAIWRHWQRQNAVHIIIYKNIKYAAHIIWYELHILLLYQTVQPFEYLHKKILLNFFFYSKFCYQFAYFGICKVVVSFLSRFNRFVWVFNCFFKTTAVLFEFFMQRMFS